MAPILDDAQLPENNDRLLPNKVINSLALGQFIFHLYFIHQVIQTDFSMMSTLMSLLFVVLPLLVLYFIVPVFLLFILQIILYSAQTAIFLEEGKGWWLRLKNWQQQCTYLVVLIGCQMVISYFAVHFLLRIS